MPRFIEFTPLKSENQSALYQLMEAAGGHKVEHFRTIRNGKLEIKFFYTGRKIILMKFYSKAFHGIEYRLRYPRDSLLSLEAYVEEYLKAHQVEHHAVFTKPINIDTRSISGF